MNTKTAPIPFEAKRVLAWRLYTVHLIHRDHDWNASFTYAAPNARTARGWALLKLAAPKDWLIIRAEATKS